MSTSYTSSAKLGEPGANDTAWNVPLNANFTALDAMNSIGGLCVTTHEQPSASLGVDIAAGSYIKRDRTVGTYAGVLNQAITASTTKVLYLDGTASWALVVGSSYPATPHIRLATVVAGSSTITSITDNRQCFPSVGTTVTTDTDGATVTFDLSVSLTHLVVLGGNRTLAISNPQAGGKFDVLLKQDATGSRTVTWWSGISWGGGSAPTLTTTANKTDSFGFLCTGSGAYIDLYSKLNH